MIVAGRPSVTYSDDDADRLTGIVQAASTLAIAYDLADRRTTLTLPNGIAVGHAYDVASQLTGLTYTHGAATLGTLTYSYDLAGRRTGVGGTWARTGLPATMSTATYDAANQILAWNGTPSTYDANGNLTSDGTRTYTWNARNQLTGLSGGASASLHTTVLDVAAARPSAGLPQTSSTMASIWRRSWRAAFRQRIS